MITNRRNGHGRQTPAKAAAGCALAGVLLMALTACSSNDKVEHTYPESVGGTDQNNPTGRHSRADDKAGRIFGKDGLIDKRRKKGAAIGVNSYLWRASLDTLSFMPLASADPFGGVIVTDWYSNPQVPYERFKVTVYILDRRLRADGIRVAVFHQKFQDGIWVDATATDETRVKLENAILTRARQLRVGKLNQD